MPKNSSTNTPVSVTNTPENGMKPTIKNTLENCIEPFQQFEDCRSKNGSQQEEFQLDNPTHEFVQQHYKHLHPQCDLLGSLLHQGYAWDDDLTVHVDQCNGLHVLADALQELLGTQGTLCGMYEVVTMQAAVIPNQESA
jgi:hypothetical protein